MAKAPTDRVNVTLRITEQLRARLEAAAEASGQSLNSEITARLERAFEARGILAELFGDDRIFGCLMTMALALKQVQHRIGDADWKSDRIAQDAVSEAVITVLSAYTKPDHASRTWKIDDPFPDPKATAIGKASAEAALRLADPPHKTAK